MKILQTLVIGKNTLIFTENPGQDIVKIKELYNDENRTGYMGYEEPILVDWEFLGNKYKAIRFWHDNEDISDIELKETITEKEIIEEIPQFEGTIEALNKLFTLKEIK